MRQQQCAKAASGTDEGSVESVTERWPLRLTWTAPHAPYRHYVYVHRKESTGEVFYVGKGSNPDRASERRGRNSHWVAIARKHGIRAEIVLFFETDTLAQNCERDLIAWYGRTNLVNKTDGGDGCAGIVMSAIARKKLSELAKRPRSEAWIRAIRRSRAHGGNGGVVRHGDKLPSWWCARIAAKVRGEKNHRFGVAGLDHHGSRLVLLHGYNLVFASIAEAAKFLGVRMQTLHARLSGRKRNPYDMSLLDDCRESQ